MSTDSKHELLSFHEFVATQLNAGQPDLTPEEALDAWRSQHPAPHQFGEDVQALREALADMEAGDTGIPLETFRAEFRKQHKLDCEP